MRIEPAATDAAEFARQVEQIIASATSMIQPPEFYVVKVDNWFGPKWLAFSHKVMGAFGLASLDLVIPPFVPSRIVSETLFTLGESDEYETGAPAKPLHVRQTSDANAARKLSRLFPRAALFWWSGQSKSNGRGSLMAYVPAPDGHVPWYVELSEHAGWGPTVAKGITASELQDYNAGLDAGGAV